MRKLSESRMQVLLCLFEMPACKVVSWKNTQRGRKGNALAMLSSRTGLSNTALAQSVPKMERDGLIVRNPGEGVTAIGVHTCQLTQKGFHLAKAELAKKGEIDESFEPPVALPERFEAASEDEDDEVTGENEDVPDDVSGLPDDSPTRVDEDHGSEEFALDHPQVPMRNLIRYIFDEVGYREWREPDLYPIFRRKFGWTPKVVKHWVREARHEGIIDIQVDNGSLKQVMIVARVTVPAKQPDSDPVPDDIQSIVSQIDHGSNQDAAQKILEALRSGQQFVNGPVSIMDQLRSLTGLNEGAIVRLLAKLSEFGAVEVEAVRKWIHSLVLGSALDDAPIEPSSETVSARDEESASSTESPAETVDPAVVAPVEVTVPEAEVPEQAPPVSFQGLDIQEALSIINAYVPKDMRISAEQVPLWVRAILVLVASTNPQALTDVGVYIENAKLRKACERGARQREAIGGALREAEIRIKELEGH